MKSARKIFTILLLLQFIVISSALPSTGQTGQSDQAPTRKRIVNQDSQSQELGEGETLKIGVELVQVVFSVVDEQNRLVTNLQPSDIEIYEGGQPQQVDLFQSSNSLPMVLAILIDMSGSQEFLLTDEKTEQDT